tara:strand:+ start:7980 stop:8972 length:993 start_codon:yes stop_codon:yes gene_type:complete
MAGLFDVVNRRRRSKELADKFREGASTEELAYFDRFYQEPSSSPVMARGALEGELDSADALQRQLMARGMNNLQAQDAVMRAKAQEEAELDRMAGNIAGTRGPNTIGGTGPGSYEDYQQSVNTGQSQEGKYAAYKRQIPQNTGGWGIHPDDQDQQQPTSFEDFSAQNPPTGPQPLGLDEWSRQSAMKQRMAGDVSAEADARYKSETVGDRISILQEQAKALPSELKAKGASEELTIAYMRELNKHLATASAYPPDSPEHQNAVNEAEQLHKLVKGTSGGGGFSSYGAGDFIKSVEDGVQRSQASGDTVVEQDGQQLIVPRQTYLEGEYRK